MRFALAFLLALGSSFCVAQMQYIEQHNVVYTQGNGFPQVLDYFQPIGGKHMRAIVFIHGGGWSAGSKEAYTSWGRYYASQGYFCVSINYRLTQIAPWPAQIDDAQAAVRWVRKHAEFFKVDPERVAAVGASAGGHLAQMLGVTDTFNDVEPPLSGYSSKVKLVGNYFGPTDMTRPNEWNPTIWQLIMKLAGQRWWPGSPAYMSISPLYYASPDDAISMIFHGDADATVPVAQSRLMAEALKNQGVEVQYMEFPGQGHGFTNVPLMTSIVALTDYLDARL
jgi:acetyl esterase/lipase